MAPDVVILLAKLVMTEGWLPVVCWLPTLTVTELFAVPELLLQERKKVVVFESEPVLKSPETLRFPAQPPVPPLALQEVALVADQVMILLPLKGTLVGLAVMEMVGF